MQNKYIWTILLVILLSTTQAFAQVTAPKISSAKFNTDGKLEVTTSFEAISGCYLAVNGGLSESEVSTGITAIKLTAAQSDKGRVTIKTKRKYYCKKRKLYVNVELTCLNDVIGSATSSVKAVSVPLTNFRK